MLWIDEDMQRLRHLALVGGLVQGEAGEVAGAPHAAGLAQLDEMVRKALVNQKWKAATGQVCCRMKAQQAALLVTMYMQDSADTVVQ